MDISTNYSNGDKTNTNFNLIEFETVEQLQNIVKKDWTPSVCIGGRTLDHFAYTQFLFGDVDNDSEDESTHCSIEQFHEIFKGTEYYIITSRNHQKAKNKSRKEYKWISPARDRFHVLFPLSEDCYDLGWVGRQLDELCKLYPFFDNSAKGSTRFYFGHDSSVVLWNDGKRMEYVNVEVPQQEYIFTGTTNTDLDASLNKRILERLLNSYNAGYFKDYGDWIKCGQALKACGFTIDDWRLITDHTVTEKILSIKWNGFKPSKIGKGSLIDYARKTDPEFLKPGSIKSGNVHGNNFSDKGEVRNSGRTGQEDGSTGFPGLSNLPGNDETKSPGTDKGNGLSLTEEEKQAPKYLDFYTKMDVEDFPDWAQVRRLSAVTGQPEWIKVAKGTMRNVEVMLKKYGIEVKYNLMAHRPEIFAPGIKGEGNNQNASYGIIISLVKLNGLDCLSAVPDYIQVLTNKNKFHPVKDWIRSGIVVWDGVDRLSQLVNAIDLADNFPKDKFELYLRKWLLSCYAAIFHENYRGRGVLTFQGRQYQGKSAFFKVLMNKENEREWFTEGLTLDPKNKDSVALAISHWISELGELEGTFKRSDVSSLKAFLTKESDIIRMPYDRREETYPRRSVFCASVNDPLFLTDDTGSSRFWVVPIDFIHLDRLVGFDSKQLWLQVKTWFDAKEQWWMTQEEDMELQKTNNIFNEKDPYEDKILSMYKMADKDMPDNILRHITVSEIAEELGIKILSKSITNSLARCIRKMGFRFKHTKFGGGYLMPVLYNGHERDAKQIEHVMDVVESIREDAV
jgi:putative DNA primase/helicase